MDFENQNNDADAPILILGLLGFSREQERAVESLLDTSVHGPAAWRLGSLAQADAWWANGARVQILGDGSLRIGSGEPGGRSVRLALEDVHRPIAFAEPLATRDFEPALSFSIDDPAGMVAMLALMQKQWLAGTAVRLWLAARLLAAEGSLVHRTYHLLHAGRLLAVIDRTGDIGLMPGLTLEQLECATWSGRPSSAAYIPPGFQHTTVSELVWAHALRTGRDLLPVRYRTGRIFLRRPPKLAQRLLADDHLLAMRELSVRPRTFNELQECTGLAGEQLARALAALYLVGSITTNPARLRPASVAPVTQAQPNSDRLWSPTGQYADVGAYPAAPRADFTVPVGLAFAAQPVDERASGRDAI